MQEACLLCLEERKNEHFDCIMADTRCWREFNIKEVVEKHFWPLNDMLQQSSWLCLKCWQEVNDFHEFYVSIEKAHNNFRKLKAIKQDLTSFPLLEPEILINNNVTIKCGSPIMEPSSEYVPKFFDDPLEKLGCKTHIEESKINCSGDIYTEENMHIKLETNSTTDISNCNSNYDFGMDDIKKDGDYSKDSAHTKRARTYIKRNKNYKENDIFIMTHFKQMACDLCQVQFKDFPDMQKHFLEIHKQVGYLMCCSRKFHHRNRLVDHIHKHLNPEHFKCDQCGKVLSDRVKLKCHMLSVHRLNNVDLQHSCEVCGKSFIKSYVLRKHKLTHVSEAEKKFPCSDCGKRYASDNLLKRHREDAHLNKDARICCICGLTLRTNREYNAHMNKHENITTNMNCDICGLRVTSERGLKVHKESQHPVGGKQEHKCPKCSKVSPTIRALKKHYNTMHVRGYEYKCSLCGKAFKRSEALKEHIASHTGTALYTCPWCPKTFNSNANMHAHRKKMHPKEWEAAKLQKYVQLESLHTGNHANEIINLAIKKI